MRRKLRSSLSLFIVFFALGITTTLKGVPIEYAQKEKTTFSKWSELKEEVSKDLFRWTNFNDSNFITNLNTNFEEGIEEDDFDCFQDWYDGVANSAPGLSAGNMVANDVSVLPNGSFLVKKIIFDLATTNGEPTELDLKIFDDNGTGGVGAETGTQIHFDSSNMTYELTGYLYFEHPQYTVELTLPGDGLLLENDTDEMKFYWLAIQAGNSTEGVPLFWPSYNYPQNVTSPTWQYTVSVGSWFKYQDNNGASKEGLMKVEGVCTGDPMPEPQGCEWTVQVFSGGWGDEVNWSLKDEETDETILAGGPYGSGFNEIRTAVAEGPVYFSISAMGNNGDNQPYYIVSNGNGVVIEGKLNGGDEMIYHDLTCPEPYCEPEINCANGNSITNVTFREINNTTTCSENGYGDYTDKVAQVKPGETYPISITVGDGSVQHLSVWIDFGKDGSFDTEDYLGEIGSAVQNGTVTGEIAIPANAEDGAYRMRISAFSGSVNEDACLIDETANGEFEDYTIRVDMNLTEGDCGQGDDSFNFFGGFAINANDETMAADDFFVSAGNTLNVQQIELNIMADMGVADFMDFSFYHDNGGLPEEEPFLVVSDVPVTIVPIGMASTVVYTVFAEVDLTFTEGHYWMRPKVKEGFAWWETTPIGKLGNPMAIVHNNTPWTPHQNQVNGVFKLHCEPVTPPSAACLFSVDEVEPITRVIMADVDNTSSSYSSEELEDFTDIQIQVEAGETYDFAAEGYTNGEYTNHFAVFIDTSELGDWSDYLSYEIGEITNSDGDDGQQATAQIEIPASLADGNYTLRVIKNYDTMPQEPCGHYNYGQAEDYTLKVGEGMGVNDLTTFDFSYYPNPVKDVLNINSKAGIQSGTVYNMAGQKVMDLDQTQLANKQIEVSSLVPGVHIFRIVLENGQIETFKIIKK